MTGGNIPTTSPRHPRFSSETRRVGAMLARDAEAAAHESAMASERAEERAYLARPKRKDEPEQYQPSRYDRPAKWDRGRIAITNPSEPVEARKRFAVLGPDRDHPLRKAKSKLTELEYQAGNRYRDKFEAAYEQGGCSDSTQRVYVDGGGRFTEQERSKEQKAAQGEIAHWEDRLGRGNAAIIRKFCGERMTMANAVHSSVTCHPDGVLARVKEALQALAEIPGVIQTNKSADRAA